MNNNKHEKGQTLIIMAFAMIALIGFTALAIDGGRVFSDRRHSQNASDTAAFASALARVRANPDWKQNGLDRAAGNDYANDGTTEVEVYLCSEWETLSGERCKALPAGAKPEEYVYVRIKSVVKLIFARVIGWKEVTNYTDAIVHASPRKESSWFNGKALVSAMRGCRSPGDNHDPFVVGGNGTTVVNNSGIFVNSNCEPAFTDNGTSNLVTTSAGVCVVGGVPGEDGLQGSVNGVTPPPDNHCGSQIDINQFWMPDTDPPNLLAPYCSQPGSISGSGGNYEGWPGYFNKTGNQTFPDESPSGVLKLHRGIYCLYNGISLNGNWIITTDLNGNDSHDSENEGVFFYVPGGDIVFNGGSTINIHAIDSTADNFPSELLHYLIYIPPSNQADLTITGSNGSTFTGTILAPTSHITLDGSGNAFELHTQIIGYNTTITGSGNIDITYNPDEQAPAVILANLSPTE